MNVEAIEKRNKELIEQAKQIANQFNTTNQDIDKLIKQRGQLLLEAQNINSKINENNNWLESIKKNDTIPAVEAKEEIKSEDSNATSIENYKNKKSKK